MVELKLMEKCLKCKLCSSVYKITNEFSHCKCVICNKNINDIKICPMRWYIQLPSGKERGD